jgi:hypothetical protein
MKKNHDVVDVECLRHAMTDRAILVSLDEDSPRVWVPLSQCEVETKGPRIVIISMPQWLAEEKELV